MKYYIKRKNKVQGPFSKEELQARTLLPTALVRMENSEEWVRADHCKELEETVVPMPSTWWLISLITVFICLPFGIVGLLRAYRIQDLYHEGKIAEARVMSQDTGRLIKIGIACGLLLYLMLLAFHGAAIIKSLNTEGIFF